MLKAILIGKEGKTDIKYKTEEKQRVRKDGVIEKYTITTKDMIKGHKGGDHLTGRILRPSEFIALQNVLSKLDNIDKKGELTNLNCLLLGGWRYEEARRSQWDANCFDGNFITVENKKTKSKEIRGSTRNIRLSSMGKAEIRHFFGVNKFLPTVSAYNEKLKRWAHLAEIDEDHISVRMLRKTYESWLAICYPNHINLICESQGHTEITANKYYIKSRFTDEEIQQMRPFVEGWIPADKGW